MKRIAFYIAIAVLAVVVLPASSYAQANQQCTCVAAGCNIVSDPFPLPPAPQPTLCTVYKNGSSAGTTVPVLSSSIVINAAHCMPSNTAYNPGPAGSLACDMPIPAFPAANNVNINSVVTYGSYTSPQGTAIVFDNVATFTMPPAANLRVR